MQRNKNRHNIMVIYRVVLYNRHRNTAFSEKGISDMDKQGIIIHPEELTDNMIELLKKTNVNVLGLHPVGGHSAHKSLEQFLELLQTESFQEKLKQVRSLGIAIECEMHALAWLLPREEYAAHPEWFRMNQEGQRVADFNMCVSNREALEYIADRAAQLASLIPADTHNYYLWSDDVDQTFCNCEKCRELSPSDQVMIIYNAILKGLRRTDPEAKQCFLAYHETMVPPENVLPDEGIFLEYAPMWADTLRPIYDKTCETNRKFCDAIEPLLTYFGKENAQILEYWLDNSKLSNWTKPPKPIHICTDTIRKDIVYYRNCGFAHITTFGCYLSDDYIELYGTPPIVEYGECFKG